MSAYAEIPIVVLAPSTGNPVQGASVTVTRRSDAGAATVYTTEAASAVAPQPLTTDSQGRVQGWMVRGQYNAEISGGGLPTYTEPFDIAPAGDASIDQNWLGVNSVSTAALQAVSVTAAKMAGFAAPVNALPSSPGDGQICFFQNAAMEAAGIIWPFRYRLASSSAYKWEFIGGSPLFSEVATQESLGSANAYVNLATVGPSVTLPLAGDYDVEVGAVWGSISTSVNTYMSYSIGATAAVDADAAYMKFTNTTHPSQRPRRKTGLSAVALTAKYKVDTVANPVNIHNRWMRVQPVRVG